MWKRGLVHKMSPKSIQKQCLCPPGLLWAEPASLEHWVRQINGKVKGKMQAAKVQHQKTLRMVSIKGRSTLHGTELISEP